MLEMVSRGTIGLKTIVKASMKKYLFPSLAVLSCLTTGCQSHSPPKDAIESWFKAQDEIAAVLNENIGGPRFKIVAIKGAIYPLGTTFYGTSPSRGCQFSTNDIFHVDLSPWPAVFQNRTFGFDVSVPFDWAAAIGAGKAGANLKTQRSFQMRYSHLQQEFVYDETLLSQISDGVCRLSINDITARPRPIIRGYIIGTLVVSSTNSFDISANCSVTNVAGLAITYSANKGFLIEQTNAIAWFGIYSIIQVGKEYREMAPEKIRQTMEKNPGAFATSKSGTSKSGTGKSGTGKSLTSKSYTSEFGTSESSTSKSGTGEMKPEKPVEITTINLNAPSDEAAAALSLIQ